MKKNKDEKDKTKKMDAEKRKENHKLDDALEDTFPASDPIQYNSESEK